ncbi:MAG: PstS family phosphate ABC transporter substrate-binding protein [Candidatus Zipacnadales bacterium]
MNRRFCVWHWAIAVVFILWAVGCAKQRETAGVGPADVSVFHTLEPQTPAVELEGTIQVSRAFALYPLMVQWADKFQALHPRVRIDVSAGGAGKGASDALGGLVDIGMVSRAIKIEEEQKGGWWIPVVKDAVVPTINDKNPVLAELKKKGVKQETLVGIWIDGTVKRWGQVVGTEARDEVHVYTRSDACGAAETWAKFLGREAQEALKGVGVYGDPGLAKSIAEDPLGIGYNNVNYAFDPKSGIPIVGICVAPLDLNSNGKLDPTEDFYETREDLLGAIRDGRYPTPPVRDLNLLSKGKPSGVTAEFLKWILTEGQKYVEPAGYITLPDDRLKTALEALGQNS